jgi:hypothetical protein
MMGVSKRAPRAILTNTYSADYLRQAERKRCSCGNDVTPSTSKRQRVEYLR